MNLQAAADRLGVHYQTAYRWVREGQLHASKIGSAYEVDDAEVERFLARRLLPAAPPERMRVRDWEVQRTRYLRAILAGDELDARDIVDRLADGHVTMLELCTELFGPCMATIGDDWHAGRVNIAAEHRATAITERMLARVAIHPRGRPRGTVVVSSLPGDLHGLPTLMAATVLREDRWRVHHLGANTPIDSLLEITRSVRADLVVLSSSTVPDADVVQSMLDHAQAEGFAVLVGGPGSRLRDLLAAARLSNSASEELEPGPALETEDAASAAV